MEVNPDGVEELKRRRRRRRRRVSCHVSTAAETLANHLSRRLVGDINQGGGTCLSTTLA